jgi:hypothetical protein
MALLLTQKSIAATDDILLEFWRESKTNETLRFKIALHLGTRRNYWPLYIPQNTLYTPLSSYTELLSNAIEAGDLRDSKAPRTMDN